MEVKKEEEEDEGAETQGDGKGNIERGSSEVKAEEKPEVRLSETDGAQEFGCESQHFSDKEKVNPNSLSQIKKEKPSGDGCKGEPMDTSSSSESSAGASEDKKPVVKKEPKEEEEGSTTNSSPAAAQSKKKSEHQVMSLELTLIVQENTLCDQMIRLSDSFFLVS